MILESQYICQFQTHQNNPITHICISKLCNLTSRWLCKICHSKQIHQCDTSDQNIITLQDLQNYFDNQLNPYYQEQFLEGQKSKKSYQYLINIRKHLDEIINIYQQKIKQQELLDYAFTQQQQSISQISFKNYQIHYEAVQDQIQHIIGQFQQFNNQILNYQLYFQKQCSDLQTAQISLNEKQQSYCSIHKHLSTINLRNKKFLNKKIFKQNFEDILYSPNSKFLLVEEERGGECLRVFQTKINFKQIFRKNIARDRNHQILFQNNQQLMTFRHFTIQVLDIVRRSIQEIKVKMGIQSLDFDTIKQQIIVVNYDGVFVFSNQLGEEIITICLRKEISKIKKTINDDNIIVQKSNFKKLHLYQIDYENESMILLQKFQISKFVFQSVCDDQRIIIQKRDKILILDKDFQTIQQLSIQDSLTLFVQVQSLNYIMIVEQESLYLQILKKNYF